MALLQLTEPPQAGGEIGVTETAPRVAEGLQILALGSHDLLRLAGTAAQNHFEVLDVLLEARSGRELSVEESTLGQEMVPILRAGNVGEAFELLLRRGGIDVVQIEVRSSDDDRVVYVTCRGVLNVRGASAGAVSDRLVARLRHWIEGVVSFG